MFDIHKVKPVHGWREFFGEVGIIVLGVVIALGLEQVAEFVHWQHKVRETYDPLTTSVGTISLAAIEQQIVTPCINQQLDSLEKNLLTPGRATPVQRFSDPAFGSYVVRAPTRPWGDSVWSTVIAEGISTHYPSDLRDTLDRFYSQSSQDREVARQVDQIIASLNALALELPRDTATASHFAEEIEQVRSKINFLSLSSSQLLGGAAEVKMLPPTDVINRRIYEQSGTITFCRAHHLNLGTPAMTYTTGSGPHRTVPLSEPAPRR